MHPIGQHGMGMGNAGVVAGPLGSMVGRLGREMPALL